jgi:riboflavin biosynthesis pyrimidine reductase
MIDTAWSFLQPLYANLPKGRVHVTLTYAQSLDGRIAGPHGKQIRLSSKESMTMTHT